jgi:hypothetical protein
MLPLVTVNVQSTKSSIYSNVQRFILRQTELIKEGIYINSALQSNIIIILYKSFALPAYNGLKYWPIMRPTFSLSIDG